jgi:hypothetical protein
VALDPSAVFDQPSDQVWNLGTFSVWFKEGVSLPEYTRKMQSTKYFLKDPIIA